VDALKKILISVAEKQTRAAIIEAGRLAELYMEAGKQEQKVGNIYRGRVVDVLTSMQAAFVDIGMEKNAFLYIDDALPVDWQQGGKEAAKPNIRELVCRGEELLVQINKEATGTKAPRVTTQISLPGRILVYLPYGQQVSVSRRIQDETERKRLQQQTASLLEPGEGAILRTLAEGVDARMIAGELAYLREVWREAIERSKQRKPPVLVFQDADLAVRVVRDAFAEDVDELVIDDSPTFQRIRRLVSALYPHLLDRLSLFQGKRTLFEEYGVEGEIDKALRRQVWLKSGGTIVIDQTEAMTVIDVNTGK
jgi:ribonuclease G